MARQHFAFTLLAGSIVSVVLCGCKSATEADSSADSGNNASVEQAAPSVTDSSAAAPLTDGVGLLDAFEIDSAKLLAAALPPEQLDDGWVRIFDGQSPYGWFLVGDANWRIADGVIKVDKGDRSYLCTSFQLKNYELQIDFRGDENTNSGIFLRTRPQPEDVGTDCLELNIAPPDNAFPTGSFVERMKVEPEKLGRFDPTAWHTYRVRLVDQTVEVFLDGKQILEMQDFESRDVGHISLQHNAGRVEFRNILMRPINGTPLALDKDWEDDWAKEAKDDAEFSVEPVADGLQLTGGLGKLETKQTFGDFVLQAKYTLAKPDVNSGIFFRCVPDSMLDGYECQVNHAVSDNDPLRPADSGAGAIFRRQPARIVMGDGTSPTYLTLLANGPQMVTWVNGVQVVEFTDTREPDENPRRGLRVEAGPIALQGHDPTTSVIFHEISVGPN